MFQEQDEDLPMISQKLSWKFITGVLNSHPNYWNMMTHIDQEILKRIIKKDHITLLV